MSTHTTTLVDAAARLAIREALSETLLVEAAAGTGKTTELVGRIRQVILSGAGDMSSIAALTFTEKAAGELKLRLRTEIDRALFDEALPIDARERARAALSALETANISTIHGFCTELLRRYPIEAAIDPDFQVAQAEREQMLLSEAFESWLAATLADPPEGVRRVLARREQDGRGTAPEQQLLAAAKQLVGTRDFDAPFIRPDYDRKRELEECATELQALAALHVQGGASDPLRRSLLKLHSELSSLATPQASRVGSAMSTTNAGGASAATDSSRLLEADWDQSEATLRRIYKNRDIWTGSTGRGQLFSAGVPRADVVARRDAVKERLELCIRACDADVASCIASELRVLVQAYELAKREAGLLDFFDLLLVTRDLLQQSAELRQQLQAAFSHVFVDEFQDTDPVQSEIVLLLCADDPRESQPFRTRPIPGKLFLVGDPKQSIYRFRRADIALYERVKRHLTQAGARVLQLTTSFRALPEIQACVNAAFAPVMSGDAERGQTSYVPLHAFRPGRTTQPALVGLSVPDPFGYSGRITKWKINQSLPDAVAAWLAWLVRESGWVVREHGRDVPVAARHVCLLFRRFRAYGDDVTRAYKEALAARELPHVQSGGRSYHDRTEVIALRSLLYAIEWPDDRLHVYATLRGPWVAFHDETLFSFQQRVGHLSPIKPLPEDLRAQLSQDELAVAEMLELLGELHRRRNRLPIAHTLSRFLEHTRAHAGLAISKPHGEQALANVLRLLDLARSYERRSESSSFRGFVGWLEDQADEAQTAEAAVAEETSEGVRIMTVHAAKGLEFPVVVLCDPTAPLRPEYASRYIDPERKLWAQSLCESEPLELWQERDNVRDHDAAEVVRLTYVAVTRAQEILVVPVCGDGPIEGWVEVLHDALYPPRERCRQPLQDSTYQLPEFGEDSVASRAGPMPDSNIAPGVHVPTRGEQHVVFWDPSLLSLSRSNVHGVAQMEMLQSSGDDAGDRASNDAYLRFRSAAERTRLEAAVEGLRSRSITAHAALADAQHPIAELLQRAESAAAQPHDENGAAHSRVEGTAAQSRVENSAAHAHGENSAAHAHGENTAAHAHGENTAAHAHGENTAAHAHGENTAAHSHGENTAAHAHGENSVKQPRDENSVKQPRDENGVAQPRAAASSAGGSTTPQRHQPVSRLSVIDTHGPGTDRSKRSRGARFGSLVHQLLEHVDYADPQPALAPLALALGRELGASEEERAHAAASVQRALAHDFFGRVRSAAQRGDLYRELPIVLCGADGTLFDGVIDLAFREPSPQGEQLWVIDFKTDVELTNLEHYETQLSMYASAATRALDLPANIVLLRV